MVRTQYKCVQQMNRNRRGSSRRVQLSQQFLWLFAEPDKSVRLRLRFFSAPSLSFFSQLYPFANVFFVCFIAVLQLILNPLLLTYCTVLPYKRSPDLEEKHLRVSGAVACQAFYTYHVRGAFFSSVTNTLNSLSRTSRQNLLLLSVQII